MSLRMLAALSACVLLLQACAGMKSEPVGGESDGRLGIVYSLPTTRIPLFVSFNEKTDRISVTAKQPLYIADENHTYRLRSIYSPSHAEAVDLKVDANGLLTTVKFDSEGRLDEALVALARSAGVLFPESAKLDQAGEKQVFAAGLDLAELAARDTGALARLNGQINAALRASLGEAESAFLTRASAADGPIVTLEVARSFPGAFAGVANEDCGAGFCYRRPVSYTIRAHFFDGTVQETLVSVPNGSPTFAAALKRGAFTKWTNEVTVENGMLVAYKYVTDGSEFERAASLPFELVGGFIEGVTQRGKLFNSRASLIQSEIALARKREERREQAGSLLRENTLGAGANLFDFRAGARTEETTGQALQQGVGQENGQENGQGVEPGNDGGFSGPSGPSTGGDPGTGN